MLINKQPYFMNNEEWFDVDEDNDIIILTDKAPKDDIQVKNSYRDYLKRYILRKQLRGGLDQNDVDIDNDEEFNKFINDYFEK